ncbi:MAG: GGDEF domain-containing protein [Betaproteobacteria bacterium]
MSFDISTLILLTIAIAYGLGALSIVFSYLQAGTRGARQWGMGMIGLGAGYTFIFLHPYVPGHALLYLGWLCIVTSVLLMYRALHLICETGDGQAVFSIAVMGGAITAWWFFAYVVPNPIRQVDTTSVAISLITGRAAWNLWRHAQRSRYRAPALAVTGWLLVVTTTPIMEILMRETGSGAADSMIEYGPPAVVFARVVIIALLSISVLWLEISRLYETIENQAMHDELTGIANRRAIIAQLQRELSRGKRENSPCSIAILDVDHFKHVNDTWGHPTGDKVLQWMANVIGNNIRPYDTLGRYGGEEFLMLMPGTAQDLAASIVDRARLAVENQACIVDNKAIRITISAGIATYSKDVDLDALLLSADHALYRAKESGRNRVVIATTPQSAPGVAASPA